MMWLAGGLLAYCILREWMWGRERRDLYDRIMCRDMNEYRAAHPGKGKPETTESADKRAIKAWRGKYQE